MLLKHCAHNTNAHRELAANGQTYIREVPCHTTALAVLVPQWRPLTESEAVRRQATALAGAARTIPVDVTPDPTKDAGGTFLLICQEF